MCKDLSDVIVQSTSGRPIFRCSDKKARYYLKRGTAVPTRDGQLRLVRDNIERGMLNRYGSLDYPYFLAPKFSRCVVCGSKENLTQHHVVPKRHIKEIEPEIRQLLCNNLCVCDKCHAKYERVSEQEPFRDALDHSVVYAIMWRDHFIETLNPRYLPEGWDILMPMPDDGEPI